MGSGKGGQRERGRGRLGDPARKTNSDESFVSAWVKWLMFSFNMFFWLAGCLLIGIGVWAYFATQDYNIGSSTESGGIFDIFFDVSLLFIIFGGVIFILGFFGAIGALRENICFLKTFAALLLIIFLIEVGIVVAVFALSETVKTKLTELLKDEAIRDYRDDINRQNIIDWFQETFECCGVGGKGWRAWESNRYFNCSSEGFEACSVPYSCCKNPYTYDDNVANTRCGANMLKKDVTVSGASSTIHTRGCVDAAVQKASDNMFVIGGVGIAVVIPQLGGIFLAKVLWGQIDDQKTRWGAR